MPKFGKNSLKQRSTVGRKLKGIVDRAIEIFDFSFVCGRRSKADQNKAVRLGHSKVRWPNSKHNVLNDEDHAKAMDLYPYPRPIWTGDLLTSLHDYPNSSSKKEKLAKLRDWARWYYLAGLVKGIAHEQGIDLRQGCNWDSDSNFTDQNFDDIPHHELRS